MSYFTTENSEYTQDECDELNAAIEQIVGDDSGDADYVQSVGDAISNLWTDTCNTCGALVAAYEASRN